MRHLEHLGIAGLAVTPDPVRVATEGALWGAVTRLMRLPPGIMPRLPAGRRRYNSLISLVEPSGIEPLTS
jgi:hypothetical protein